MLAMNFYSLVSMEMQKGDLEKNSAVFSSKKEHKVLSQFLVATYLIEVDTLHPFLIKNIKELQASQPKKYQLLKKMQSHKSLSLKKKKKHSLVKAHKIGSRLLIASYNDHLKDCDKKISTTYILSGCGLGALAAEIAVALCLLIGVLPAVLTNC